MDENFSEGRKIENKTLKFYHHRLHFQVKEVKKKEFLFLKISMQLII
jgi:hypothetical protein